MRARHGLLFRRIGLRESVEQPKERGIRSPPKIRSDQIARNLLAPFAADETLAALERFELAPDNERMAGRSHAAADLGADIPAFSFKHIALGQVIARAGGIVGTDRKLPLQGMVLRRADLVE